MKKIRRSSEGHTWRFFRAGGFDQVRIDSGQDLQALEQLDQKLWVALACPVDNVHFDGRTLSLIDTDGDRRIRAAELIAAIKWSVSLLKNPDELVSAEKQFSLQKINDTTEDGKALTAAARNAIAALGKQEGDPITVADIESLEKVLSQKTFNGDGIITEEAASDETIKGVIKEIIAVLGSVPDRSGNPGINSEKIETFFDQARDYKIWVTESERDLALQPLGGDTEEAAKATIAVRAKIEDYFARCAIAAFDSRAIVALDSGEKVFETVGKGVISRQCIEIADLPIARIQPQGVLPFGKDLNPAWIDKIKKFQDRAVRPLLGSIDMLSESQWQHILASFAPCFAWYDRKPATPFDIARVRALLNSSVRETLMGLIERDKAESVTFTSLIDLEKLIRFHRDLYSLCTNFVNFKDFYAKAGMAIFKAGTLYLDQRSCKLCMKIDDPNKHSLMAAMAGTYLVYCECRRRGGAEKMNIVAAFTNGDSENLIVGRNGVFYDRAGKDWDANIIKIIENPISIRQAFWLPYKSLVRMIESQVAKRATAAEAQSTTNLQQTAVAATNIEKSKSDLPPKKLDIGIVAALGVAAGALGTFVATILGFTAGIIRLGPLAIVGALVGLLLLISGPSIILAYIKLRKRNLGPILDANGWAINAKARINVPFGTALTHVAALPPGAQRDLIDPYMEKKSLWPKVAILVVLIYIVYTALNHLGFVNEWSGGRLGLKKQKAEQTQSIDKKPIKAAPATQE